jgi:ADP-ribosylglycohydrolase
MELYSSLILGVIGDILGFNDGLTKTNRPRFTKKKFGDKYIQEGKWMANENHFEFIYNGGVNKDITNDLYSINTLMMMATLKGIINNKEDIKKGCSEEYCRVYKKIGQKKLRDGYFINNDYLNSLESLNKNENIQNNNIYNDSMVLSRIVPIAGLYWKKKDRKKMIEEIINNISLTHKNNTVYLSAITLGLFVSFSKNNIIFTDWSIKNKEFLLSKEFDIILKELKLYSTEFVLDKEDYISMWENMWTRRMEGKRIDSINELYPYHRANNLFLTFNEYNADEFIYGLKADQAIIIAYESLLLSSFHNSPGNWEKMLFYGMVGISDNSVMGTLCGIVYGLAHKFDTVNENQYKSLGWVKKINSMLKDLDL